MKNGNWVPICKTAVKTLPINRAFSEVEALFSLSCDYDNDKSVSESGLAKRWVWSRKKVRLFLERIGVNILYQIDKKRSPLGGQVGVQAGDKLGTSLEQVRFIDFNNLEQQRDKLGTSEGQARDKLGDTTIDPYPKPDPEPKEKDLKTYCAKFELFWNAYPKKKSKAPAEKAFLKLNPNKELRGIILIKIEEAKNSDDWLKENGQYIPYPATWLNARGWEDEIKTSTSSTSRWDEVRKKYGN